MADNDKKRFYWLKLKKDFFQQHQIKVLKSLPNGRLYALIYLELLAESTTHDGELRYSDTLPYDTITLSAVIDEDKDNVEKAIETLVTLELVEILSDQTIYMRDIQRLIGSESGSAERQRLHREKVKQIESVTLSQKCHQENRDKSIEIRDKRDIESTNARHKYGQYKNVLLSDEELAKLEQEIPNYQAYIERVSEYVASTGKSYKSYLATIRNWHRRDSEHKTEDKRQEYKQEW